MKKNKFQWGASTMLIIYGLLFFLMFFRIFYIQVTGQVEGQQLAAKAAARYEKKKTITADRGNILDRNGKIIAEDAVTYRLAATVNPDASKGSKKPIQDRKSVV